jgi:hypothetical protein
MAGLLYVTFIDFEKAFDSVKREVMWLTLQEYGIPRKIIQIIQILYCTMDLSVKSPMKESFLNL